MTVANAAIVKVSPGGAIKVYNSTGSVHVLADVTGFYTAPGGANGTTTTASTYTYNGDGLRVSKTTVTSSGTTSTTAASTYTYDQSLGIPVLLSDGERDYIYGPDGLPLQHLTTTTGANPTWYLTDHNGNTRALTDAAGAVQATYTYTPYGTPTRTTGAASTPLLYGRGHYDTDTGYIYLLHRYYDPATATFTTTDPLLSVSGSPYGYTYGDPLNVTDPTGLFPPLILAFIIGAAISGGIELATQAARNTAGGCGPLNNINWWKVGRSSVIGGALSAAGAGAISAAFKGLRATRAAKVASGADDVAAAGSNVGPTTAHGAERIAGAGATRGGVLAEEQILLVRSYGQPLTQADGAAVRVLQNESGRFDVVVDGSRGLITSFRNISQKSLERLALRYGWN
ncbi:MAG: RHS repeat-associated core domain-containing protein [Nocardioides sp.]